jgi:hypothetical protein
VAVAIEVGAAALAAAELGAAIVAAADVAAAKLGASGDGLPVGQVVDEQAATATAAATMPRVARQPRSDRIMRDLPNSAHPRPSTLAPAQ